ncbi:MAG: hypothetical protein CSYNP_03530 [Syntrophus sp. SKADARSKE-3]|nr:hypothetical protein [Syntrophus sp. SKADARSKE-3]
MNTPWGESQVAVHLSVGITRHHTASHGGIYVEPIQNNLIPEYMRNADGWYEEDCEWAKVAVVYPKCFVKNLGNDQQLTEAFTEALSTLREWFPEAYEHYTGLQLGAGESHTRDMQLFARANRDKMVVVSVVNDSEDSSWVICFAVRGGRGEDYQYASLDTATYRIPAVEYQTRTRFGYVVDEDVYKPVQRH